MKKIKKLMVEEMTNLHCKNDKCRGFLELVEVRIGKSGSYVKCICGLCFKEFFFGTQNFLGTQTKTLCDNCIEFLKISKINSTGIWVVCPKCQREERLNEKNGKEGGIKNE